MRSKELCEHIGNQKRRRNFLALGQIFQHNENGASAENKTVISNDWLMVIGYWFLFVMRARS